MDGFIFLVFKRAFVRMRANGRRSGRMRDRHTRARTSIPVDTAREDRFIEPSRECDSRARGERDEGDDESTDGWNSRSSGSGNGKKTNGRNDDRCVR